MEISGVSPSQATHFGVKLAEGQEEQKEQVVQKVLEGVKPEGVGEQLGVVA